MRKSILITSIFALFLSGIYYGMNASNKIPEEFSDGWSLSDGRDGGDKAVFNLPAQFKNKTNIQIQKTLPAVFDDSADTLFFYTSEQGVRVFIDGMQIYEYGMSKDMHPFMKSPASLWHKIKLDKSYAGKNISIFFSYPYKNHRGQIFKTYISNYNDFIKYLMLKYFMSLEFAVLCLIFSLIISPVLWLYRKYKDKTVQVLCICFFSFLAAVWYISDNKIILFITHYPKIPFILSLLSLMLIAFPSLIYAVNIKDLKLRSFLSKIIIAFGILYCSLIILELFSLIDIYMYRDYVHVGIYVSALTYFVSLGISLIRDKRKDVKLPFVAYLILIAGSTVDFFLYLINEENYSAAFASFSALVFITFLLITAFQSLKEIIEQNKKAALYKDLALQDFMTGTKNKSAFLSDIEDLIVSENITVVVFDINNLKKINEKCGHEKGDEAVIKIAQLIKNIFSKYGSCYRTGADEFSVLLYKGGQMNIYEYLQKFIASLRCENDSVPYQLGTAMGFATFDFKTDKKLSDTVARAKKNMEKNKTSQKLAETASI